MPISLPTLPIGGWTEAEFQIWWQQVVDAIESAVTDLETAQADLATAQTDVIAAATAATAAATDATAALNAAAVVARDNGIASSWTTPGNILSAFDAGASASIQLIDHDRIYIDGVIASVTGATLTGFGYNLDHYVYYDDPTRAGGAVAFHVVTDPRDALPGTTPGRHFLGKVKTPAAAAPPTEGGYNPPVGGGVVTRDDIP